MLVAAADEVIVPAYEALVASFDELAAELDELCTAPSTEHSRRLATPGARLAIAWQHTRAGGVGPAMDRRLASAIAFSAAADAVADLLAGTDPVDEAGVDADGRGGEGHRRPRDRRSSARAPTSSPPPQAPAAASTSPRSPPLARGGQREVLDDWTGGYRDEFVAGMDGDPQASLDALVNEVIFRVTEVDDQGLRALMEADAADELPPTAPTGRRPSAWPSSRATYEGVAAILDAGPACRRWSSAANADTGERLADAADAAAEAMAALPDSVDRVVRRPGRRGRRPRRR